MSRSQSSARSTRPVSTQIEPAIPSSTSVEPATRVPNGQTTSIEHARNARRSGDDEDDKKTPPRENGTLSTTSIQFCDDRTHEPALTMPRKKGSYTFGVYKATKIALGLKKKVRLEKTTSSRFSAPADSANSPDCSARSVSSARNTLENVPNDARVAVATDRTGPWHEVQDPMPWTGPPTPLGGPDESEEPFMVRNAKTNLRGYSLHPWEGVEVTGPAVLRIIDCGLIEASVNPDRDRPDTTKFPEARGVFHLRRAVSDVLRTPLFAFALRLFEGPETDQNVACDRFLRRLLKGCGGAVYCSITEHPPKAYEKMADSKLAGAALFLRCFLQRFAKRFPQNHGFVHPTIDHPARREALIERIGDGFQNWSFVPATRRVPAAIVVRMTNDGARALARAEQPHSWIAVNHFYEFCIAQPSREVSGHPSIFIIDLGKLSMMMYTSSNIAAIAGQLIAAMFHPEPFSAFVVAHSPSAFQFVWGVAKFFLTESARQKFVVLTGSASAHFHNKLGIPLDEIPETVGGTGKEVKVFSVPELLRLRTQDDAIRAYAERHGEDIARHEPGAFHDFSRLPKHLAGSELFRVESGCSEPGTPTESESPDALLCAVGNGTRLHSGTRDPGVPLPRGDGRRFWGESSTFSGGAGSGSRKRSVATRRRPFAAAKDLRFKISSLAEKLEKAGVVPPAHEAAKAAALEKLRDMKLRLLKMTLARYAYAWATVSALLVAAYYSVAFFARSASARRGVE